MYVIGRYQGCVGLFCQFHHQPVDPEELRDVVILQFEVEITRFECFLIPIQAALSFRQVVIIERTRDLTSQTGRSANQSLGMICQKGFVDARMVIKAFQL